MPEFGPTKHEALNRAHPHHPPPRSQTHSTLRFTLHPQILKPSPPTMAGPRQPPFTNVDPATKADLRGRGRDPREVDRSTEELLSNINTELIPDLPASDGHHLEQRPPPPQGVSFSPTPPTRRPSSPPSPPSSKRTRDPSPTPVSPAAT